MHHRSRVSRPQSDQGVGRHCRQLHRMKRHDRSDSTHHRLGSLCAEHPAGDRLRYSAHDLVLRPSNVCHGAYASDRTPACSARGRVVRPGAIATSRLTRRSEYDTSGLGVRSTVPPQRHTSDLSYPKLWKLWPTFARTSKRDPIVRCPCLSPVSSSGQPWD